VAEVQGAAQVGAKIKFAPARANVVLDGRHVHYIRAKAFLQLSLE
jgi:hypothetical protein